MPRGSFRCRRSAAMAASRCCRVSCLRSLLLRRRWEAYKGACGIYADGLIRTPAGGSAKTCQTRLYTAAAAGTCPSNFGPAVKLLVDLYGLASSDIRPSGPHGRLLKGDVLNYITLRRLVPRTAIDVQQAQPSQAKTEAAPPASQPYNIDERSQPGGCLQRRPSASALPTAPALPLVTSQPASYADVELSSMRKTIAKRLTQAKMTIPHAYAAADCVIDDVLRLRRRLADDGVKVSVNDFVVKACASALQRVPTMNAVWDGELLVPAKLVDVSVAVATDNGLITPIVKDAANLTVEEISGKLKDLAARAKAGKLKLDEFQGGTFTVSNLGMFGISEFSAVINPPQVGILAVGSARIILDTNKGKPVTAVTITLSTDARAIDDTVAAEFLATLKAVLENPYQLAVGQLPVMSLSTATLST